MVVVDLVTSIGLDILVADLSGAEQVLLVTLVVVTMLTITNTELLLAVVVPLAITLLLVVLEVWQVL
jgi:hypothetical protein